MSIPNSVLNSVQLYIFFLPKKADSKLFIHVYNLDIFINHKGMT